MNIMEFLSRLTYEPIAVLVILSPTIAVLALLIAIWMMFYSSISNKEK